MAKNKIKKISVNAFENVYKNCKAEDKVIDWYGNELVIHNTIGLLDMIEFVEDCVDAVFQEEIGFVPEILDLAIKENVLTKYANFTMPKNMEDRYNFIYETNAFDTVLSEINMVQFDEIVKQINRKIQFNCNVEATGISKELTKLVSKIEDFGDSIEGAFNGVNTEDLRKMVDAVGSGTIDEAKIVEAFKNKKKG